jgi:hypothetical protein
LAITGVTPLDSPVTALRVHLGGAASAPTKQAADAGDNGAPWKAKVPVSFLNNASHALGSAPHTLTSTTGLEFDIIGPYRVDVTPATVTSLVGVNYGAADPARPAVALKFFNTDFADQDTFISGTTGAPSWFRLQGFAVWDAAVWGTPGGFALVTDAVLAGSGPAWDAPGGDTLTVTFYTPDLDVTSVTDKDDPTDQRTIVFPKALFTHAHQDIVAASDLVIDVADHRTAV